MAIFVGSDALAFAALLFTYVGLRLQAEAWAPAVVPATGVGLGLTALLAGVSASLILARRWARAGRAGASRGALAAALILAVAFVGAQVWEAAALARAGLRLGDPFADGFYVITGYHGAHVAAGAVYLAVLLLRGERARLGPAALYWHFVDAVWLLLFAIFYL